VSAGTPPAPAPSDGITILLPVRDYRRDYLAEAIDSIMRQSAGAWELLLIVDQAEEEQVRADCAESSSDPRIRLLVTCGRKLAGKLNAGMRAARFAFTAAIFADDLWEEQAVEVLLRDIRAHPEVDVFHSSRRFIDEEGRSISGSYRSRPHVEPADFLVDAPVKHLLCWRVKAGLDCGGMDETLNSIGVDDYDFPWTLAENGAKFMAVPECLYVARDHRSHFRLTTHTPRSVQVRELRRILRKHGASRGVIRRRVRQARRTYLRQCMYANRLDRYLKLRLGREPARWREPFVP
jgi:glycosyltransferase involved in cell wall biosynthesis